MGIVGVGGRQWARHGQSPEEREHVHQRPRCDWRRLRPVADGTGKADASPARVCLWAGDAEQGGVGVLDV